MKMEVAEATKTVLIIIFRINILIAIFASRSIATGTGFHDVTRQMQHEAQKRLRLTLSDNFWKF